MTALPDTALAPMTAVDAPALAAIERDASPSPWGESQFLDELRKPHVRFLTARAGSAVAPSALSATLRGTGDAARYRPGLSDGASLSGSADEAVGYGGVWLVADEAQLANLAVAAAWRRRGVGRRLLCALLAEARAAGARRMTLEVREGNAAARRLYEAEGFRETSRRPGYYEGRETAVLMERPL